MRRPYHDAAAPTLDRGVQRRLRRLDPDLFVTWSPYSLDPLTGRPILTSGNDPDVPAGQPVPDPAWYLWRRNCDDGRTYLVGIYPHFGHREVARLEADLARFISPSEIIRRKVEAQAARLERARRAYREDHDALVRRNRRRIHDLIFEGKSGARKPRIYSYPGQTSRAERFDAQPSELLPPEQDGWELNNP